jgi:hypothetical protein
MSAKTQKLGQVTLSGDPQQGPRTVQGAKLVNLALINYTDENGRKLTQLAIIGESTVHFLEGKITGFSNVTTPQGQANEWLRDGVFDALHRNNGQ